MRADTTQVYAGRHDAGRQHAGRGRDPYCCTRKSLRASARVLRVEPGRRKPSAARPRQDLALSQLHWVIGARASNTQELRTSVSPTPSVFDLNQRHLH
jgi:hypothetical protein